MCLGTVFDYIDGDLRLKLTCTETHIEPITYEQNTKEPITNEQNTNQQNTNTSDPTTTKQITKEEIIRQTLTGVKHLHAKKISKCLQKYK